MSVDEFYDVVLEPKANVNLIQRYGYFHCKECQRQWGSPFVFIIKGTPMKVYKQGCKSCGTMIGPYQTKECQCKQKACGICGDKDKKKNIKHNRELCEKCRTGWLCNPNRDEEKEMERRRAREKRKSEEMTSRSPSESSDDIDYENQYAYYEIDQWDQEDVYWNYEEDISWNEFWYGDEEDDDDDDDFMGQWNEYECDTDDSEKLPRHILFI